MNYDVVIIGGGMVGAALACALGDSPLKVAVVESREPDTRWPPEDYDLRVSAITLASENILRSVGAWEGIVTRRVSPFREMHVWDSQGDGKIHFDSADVGAATLGHIIENGVIHAALRQRLDDFENIDWLCPAEPKALMVEADHAVLRLADDRVISARLVVGADGAKSWARSQMGIECRGWDYDQSGVVAVVKTSRLHQETAWQRFLPTGPVAFLPLGEKDLSSIVWSTTGAEATRLLSLNDTDFLAELQTAFGPTLGQMLSTGPRAAFPLKLQHATTYTAPRFALVGDAAHAIHPLAGQGVNLGFLDAAALAETILAAHRNRHDIGSHKSLRRYERWRKGDNLAVMALMDGFKRLFGTGFAPLRWVRNTGLNLTNHAGPVKKLLVRGAMGLRPDQPSLAQGRSPQHS